MGGIASVLVAIGIVASFAVALPLPTGPCTALVIGQLLNCVLCVVNQEPNCLRPLPRDLPTLDGEWF